MADGLGNCDKHCVRKPSAKLRTIKRCDGSTQRWKPDWKPRYCTAEGCEHQTQCCEIVKWYDEALPEFHVDIKRVNDNWERCRTCKGRWRTLLGALKHAYTPERMMKTLEAESPFFTELAKRA